LEIGNWKSGFETDGWTVIVAWAQEGAKPQEISLAGKPWRVVDLQGNEFLDFRFSIFNFQFPISNRQSAEFPW